MASDCDSLLTNNETHSMWQTTYRSTQYLRRISDSKITCKIDDSHPWCLPIIIGVVRTGFSIAFSTVQHLAQDDDTSRGPPALVGDPSIAKYLTPNV